VSPVLPQVPSVPDPTEPQYQKKRREFTEWLDASPDHAIGFERLRRWHLVQDELARAAHVAGRTFEVTHDGLD
jgi:ferric-dicitrate binding protein FerR (iron transport regulator)